MRIAYVITRADAIGGASIHVRDLAREMRSRGHDTIVFVGGEGVVTDQLGDAGVAHRALRHLRRPLDPLSEYRAFLELRQAVAEWRPDLVSAHTAKAGWLARAACRRMGLPVLYTPHGWAVGDRLGRLPGLAFGWAERVAARWSSAIVCVCEYERRLALARRIAPAELLHVIHNGVHDIPGRLRANPACHPPRVACLARFERPKDHPTLLAALAGLRHLEWQLDLIGDGPLEGDLRAAAARLGLSERVTFSGYQADPAQWLARAQLFVLPSRSEGFPRSVLEAMRAGLPVVASDVGGVAEAVAPGVSGLLAPAGSARGLAAALGFFLAGAENREPFGAAARHIYESRFRFEQMAGATERLYAKLVESCKISIRS